jgi:hypothetical protein
MILLLIIAIWIVVMSLVAGLCAAARVGDVERLTRAYASARTAQAQPLAWESVQDVELSARANTRAARTVEAEASLLQSDGLAA